MNAKDQELNDHLDMQAGWLGMSALERIDGDQFFFAAVLDHPRNARDGACQTLKGWYESSRRMA
jgi:hypothetical protein